MDHDVFHAVCCTQIYAKKINSVERIEARKGSIEATMLQRMTYLLKSSVVLKQLSPEKMMNTSRGIV